jgi:antitoxin ParD1/3/4
MAEVISCLRRAGVLMQTHDISSCALTGSAGKLPVQPAPASLKECHVTHNRINSMMIPSTGAGIMGTTRKTVTVTDQQDQWIKAQIEAGRFTNDSEYIRDLIRRDQETAKLKALRDAIEEGLASGPSDRTVPQIMRGVEARLKKNGVL